MKFPKNWYVLPCGIRSKKPVAALAKNWSKNFSNDPAKIAAWARKYPGCNWALLPKLSGLIVVDVDKAGLPYWNKWVKKYGKPETLTQKSGGNGGLHFVFKADPDTQYKGEIAAHIKIDIQLNNYILIAPSKIKSSYVWLNKTAPTQVPPWLLRLIKRPALAKRDKKSKEDFDPSFYSQIAEQLKDKELNYKEWLEIGMALHHASGGSDEGLDIYLEITHGLNYVGGDENEAHKKWVSFSETKTDSPITAGSFFKLARDKGCLMPDHVSIFDFFDDESKADIPIAADKKAPKKKDKNLKQPTKPRLELWSVNKKGRQCTQEVPELINRMNYAGYAQLIGEKHGRLIRAYRDVFGVKNFAQLGAVEFKNAVAQWCLAVINAGDGKNPTTSYADADKVWLQSEKKQTFKGITFSPDEKPGYLNLWETNPIPCKGMPGDVSLLLKFIEQIMCAGHSGKAEYLIQWFAHLVQRPEEKPAVVPVIIGGEGTGKGFLTNGLMRGILQSRYTMVGTRQGIKGNFNKHLAFKFLIVLDEACWQGDAELQGYLRTLTGNKTIEIEEKFGARFTIEDYLRLMITTNRPDPVFLQDTNRRYLVIENSDKYMNHPIYTKLWKMVKKYNLCEKFYHYLMQVDLSNFDPFKFPAHLDDAGTEVKLGGDIFREFLFDIFVENPRPAFDKKHGLIKSDFYEAFQNFAAMVGTWKRQITPKKFWAEIGRLSPLIKSRSGFALIDKTAVRVIKIDPLEMRNDFLGTLRITPEKGASDERIEKMLCFSSNITL